jgi:hypothetical protein
MNAREQLRAQQNNGNGRAHEPVQPRALQDVLKTFREWLYLPDPGIVYAILGAVAANLLDGDPVWLLAVGPPGGGKSEILAATGGLPNIHPAATLTEPALLSGTPKKDRAESAKGGLLREMGRFGIIVCKDFGSVLSMHRDARAAVLAALREVYDGSWTRHLGTSGGQSLTWAGKVGLLAGCTQAIDRHHAVMGAMGERFALYRLPVSDPDEQARRALEHDGREQEMREQLSSAVAGLFHAGPPATPPALTRTGSKRLIQLATLAVRCRSAVERDGYSREVELVPDAESPTRLVKALARLLAGIHAIGADDADAWKVINKCALDCIPALRLAVIVHLYENSDGTTTDIASAVKHPTQTARRALEDLAAHGVIHRKSNGQGNADTWRITEWTADRYATALTVPETSEDAASRTVPETSEDLNALP